MLGWGRFGFAAVRQCLAFGHHPEIVDTGNYSTLVSGDIISTVGSKFYPVGWHSLVALVISMTGASIGIAENAVIAMLCAIVFPVSMFVLFHCLFAGRTKLIAICSLTPLMFAAFPWRYITFWPPLFQFTIIRNNAIGDDFIDQTFGIRDSA